MTKKEKEEERLSCEHVDVKPRRIDWREALGEDMEGWTAHEAIECDECKRVVVTNQLGEYDHRDVEGTLEDADGTPYENTCAGYMVFEGPMMNFFYECDWKDADAAARAIRHLALCLVELRDGTKGLALTGGGMDLSWEICEAYALLGFAPPIHFAGDLPDMAWGPLGKGFWTRKRRVLKACARSAEVALAWAENAQARVAEAKKKLNARARSAAKRVKAA